MVPNRPRASAQNCIVHLSLVRKLVLKSNLPSSKLLKLRHISDEKQSQLPKNKICWSGIVSAFRKKIHLSFKKVQHCPPFISCTLKLQAEALCTIALSFYRSQNVLCRSKIFEPAQKFECIQCLFKNFCAGTKTNFTECKSSFCLAQNVCDCQNM